MLPLVREADGEAGLLAGDIDDTPGEVYPGLYALNVGGDFTGAEPFMTTTARRTRTQRGKEACDKGLSTQFIAESLARKKTIKRRKRKKAKFLDPLLYKNRMLRAVGTRSHEGARSRGPVDTLRLLAVKYKQICGNELPNRV